MRLRAGTGFPESRVAAGGLQLAIEIDPILLTQELIRHRTLNPPGEEDACAHWLAGLLEKVGFVVRLYSFGPKRYNLVAELPGELEGPWLGFSGHLDTVPLGSADWTRDPFAAEIENGLLYGRGSTDMKSGIAAFIAACHRSAPTLRLSRGVRLFLTGGEETGCDGASALKAQERGCLDGVGALIVGEPTRNYPHVGHKGAIWIRGSARGQTAHGSMPELGDNAVYKVVEAVSRIRTFKTAEMHSLMGSCTVNVGKVEGGLNVNSVPDYSCFEVDIRTVPGVDHRDLKQRLANHLGAEIELATFVDVPPLNTDHQHPWVSRVFATCAKYQSERIAPRVVPYFTDGSVLVPQNGTLPTIVLGPGEPDMMHKTDEYCCIDRVHEGVQVYRDLLSDWCKNFTGARNQ